AVRKYVSSALDVVIQVARLMDGTRKIVSFQEIIGMEEKTITMQEIFSYEQTGVDSKGKIQGSFRMQGVMPKFFEKFKMHGVPVPYEMFRATKEDIVRLGRW
ncbi:MAG: pilus assembly protein CpaF, partial [Deltaproteobacteria bacterium HGW-Deltaproteobacteria-7]